jgi:general secretion pathway protein I
MTTPCRRGETYRARRRARLLGFTLLEVMVALAILGLGLTSILAAQAGVFASAVTARNLSEATGLARCKMSELEEHLLREGFQELDETDSGPCCEGEDSAMSCSWKIEKLKLPEPAYGQLDLDTGLDNMGFGPLGGGGGAADLGAGLGVGAGADGADPSGMAAMLGPITQMIFPVMQGIFETSTRRITVTVTWKEGYRDQTLEVMQWVANSSGLEGGEGVGGGSSTASTGAGRTF